MKTAIIIISDPKNGEEAFARVFNALALAAEGKKAGDQVEINFIGTGTRWPEKLARVDNPANGLYNEVRDLVSGTSCGCAAAFGSTESVAACGLPVKNDNPIPGTPGLLSLRRYLSEGWNTLVF